MLTINPEVEASVQRLVSHALIRDHWYEPGRTEFVPGDLPEFTINLDSYRCVFTVTKLGGGAFRHLTISVPSKDFPHPFAAFTIAKLFGFTGWDGKAEVPDTWEGRVDQQEHCIVLMQPLTDAQASA
jgi:hypothetical protein